MAKTKTKPKPKTKKKKAAVKVATAPAFQGVEIECNRELLIDALETATSFSPVRSPKAILKNVRIDITESSAVVMATDLEIGCRVRLSGVVVRSTGNFILPPCRATSLLRWLQDATVTIQANSDGVTIRSAHGSHKFQYHNPNDFAPVHEFRESAYHEVPELLFKELIRRTAFSADSESSRYALGGVLLELEERKIIGVATDGRRLALMEGPAHQVSNHSTNGTTTIIPLRAMTLMEKVFGGGNEMRIATRENDAVFAGYSTTVWTRYVEGRFPRWRDVIPTRDETVISLPVGELLSRVNEVSVFVEPDYRGIEFVFSKGQLELSYSFAEHGSSKVSMPVEFSGNRTRFIFDDRYIRDFLTLLSSEREVAMRFRKEDEAVIFATDDGSSYVVMPMEDPTAPT